MTKKILVPTDFSANAQKALNYAVGLAKHKHYAIQLIHVYQAMTSKFGDEEFNQDIKAHAESTALHELEALRKQVQEDHPELEIEIECYEGDQPSAVLTQIAGKAHNEIIIMGTKGAGGLKHRLMGSNTFQTITNSPIPVLAIPNVYESFEMDRVGLLSNFKDTEITLLMSFTDIFGTDIPVTILHVREQTSSTEQDFSQSENQLEIWKNHLLEKTGIKNITWKLDSTMSRLDVSETLPDCIHHMAEEEDIQMLLVTYNTKPFFQRLFSRSLVKNFAHQIHRPIFFFNETIDNQK